MGWSDLGTDPAGISAPSRPDHSRQPFFTALAANPLLIHGSERDGRSGTHRTPVSAKCLVRATGSHGKIPAGRPNADFGPGER